MQLTILGGGGFRVPLIYRALSHAQVSTSAVVLHDVDPHRLQVIAAICAQIGAAHPGAPLVRATTDLDDALSGADMIFSAIRVGGTKGRVLDERVAIDAGLLGQETIGAGGLAYALRTVPVVDQIAARIAELAPRAWTINFTNPAGVITEAMRTHLGDRVFGICDTPLGLVRRVARILQVPLQSVQVDYQGVNHLGWLTGFWHEGEDLLPRLLGDREQLMRLEEVRILGVDLVRQWGAIPNEYLYYYTLPVPDQGPTRGEFLAAQQQAFYTAGAGGQVLQRWQATLTERDASYMAEARLNAPEGSDRERRVTCGTPGDHRPREAADIAAGGYHEVAVQLMTALRGGAPDSGESGSGTPVQMILGVANAGTMPQLPQGAVIEVPVTVDDGGAHRHPLRTTLGAEQVQALRAVKTSESALIDAARARSRSMVVGAFAAHPLVGSTERAEHLVRGYCRAHQQIAAVLTEP